MGCKRDCHFKGSIEREPNCEKLLRRIVIVVVVVVVSSRLGTWLNARLDYARKSRFVSLSLLFSHNSRWS